jgi:hypothetical protein
MNDSVESSNVIKIPIDKLALGMFVTAIDHQQSKVAIRNPGQIKHRDAILKLKKNNILLVWVDVDRSSDTCGLAVYWYVKRPSLEMVNKCRQKSYLLKQKA